MLLLVLLLGCVGLSAQEVPVSVTRGRDGDSVSLCGSFGGSCRVSDCPPHSSYLVEDRECVEDTTLQRSNEI